MFKNRIYEVVSSNDEIFHIHRCSEKQFIDKAVNDDQFEFNFQDKNYKTLMYDDHYVLLEHLTNTDSKTLKSIFFSESKNFCIGEIKLGPEALKILSKQTKQQVIKKLKISIPLIQDSSKIIDANCKGFRMNVIIPENQFNLVFNLCCIEFRNRNKNYKLTTEELNLNETNLCMFFTEDKKFSGIINSFIVSENVDNFIQLVFYHDEYHIFFINKSENLLEVLSFDNLIPSKNLDSICNLLGLNDSIYNWTKNLFCIQNFYTYYEVSKGIEKKRFLTLNTILTILIIFFDKYKSDDGSVIDFFTRMFEDFKWEESLLDHIKFLIESSLELISDNDNIVKYIRHNNNNFYNDMIFDVVHITNPYFVVKDGYVEFVNTEKYFSNHLTKSNHLYKIDDDKVRKFILENLIIFNNFA